MQVKTTTEDNVIQLHFTTKRETASPTDLEREQPEKVEMECEGGVCKLNWKPLGRPDLAEAA